MRGVSHKELQAVIHKAYLNKVALFIWGATGIGKSEAVRRSAENIAKEVKLPFSDGECKEGHFGFIDARLSQFDPSDLRGLPFVSQDGKTKWAYPNWLPTAGQGILFLDEANLAPPLVQSSAYQLILDRKLGDYKVPDGWGIVAAGNRAEDKAYTFELAAPLCNRFIHSELAIPTLEEWTTWGINHGIDTRIVTFLQYKPTMLYKFDSKLKDKAFPTPRSWARYCSPLIKEVDDPTTLLLLMSSAIGEGVATECVAYLKLVKQINLKDIIAHPEKVAELKGIDVKYSLVSALAEYAKKDTKETLVQAMKCTEYMEAEFAILLLRFICAGVPKFASIAQANKTVADIAKKYMKYIEID